jgi:hypothetical protein
MVRCSQPLRLEQLALPLEERPAARVELLAMPADRLPASGPAT